MSSLDERVLAGRIETLIGQQPPALVANPVNSGLLCFVLLDSLPLMWLSAWLAAIWGLSGFRAFVWLRSRRAP